MEASHEVVKAVSGRAWATASLKQMAEGEAEKFMEKWRESYSADLAKIEEREDAEGDVLVLDGKGEYRALGIHEQARRKRAREEL